MQPVQMFFLYSYSVMSSHWVAKATMENWNEMSSLRPLAHEKVLVELGVVLVSLWKSCVRVAAVTKGNAGSALTPVLRSMRPSKSLQANSTVKSMLFLVSTCYHMLVYRIWLWRKLTKA